MKLAGFCGIILGLESNDSKVGMSNLCIFKEIPQDKLAEHLSTFWGKTRKFLSPRFLWASNIAEASEREE